MKRKTQEHPYIPELKDAYQKGKINRRQFLYYATLLGASTTAAGAFLAGCTPQGSAPAPAAPAASAPAPAATVATTASTVKRGGTLTESCLIKRVDHPARMAWLAPANQFRQIFQYLTNTGPDNITRPYLLESWQPSEDLKTWTLNLRKNVTWNNGDPFVADDVIFTMKEWLNPDVGSSILSQMAYLQPANIEKVDDHTVVLHLDFADIGVAEHLFAFPGMILNHKHFEGDIVKSPIGTGPFTLAEYREGERMVLKRREDYWGMGVDGKPLPYLDEIVFVDLGEEASAHVAAFKAGQVDKCDTAEVDMRTLYTQLRDDPTALIQPVDTAEVKVMKMRCDKKPFDNEKVRMAIKLCQNREKIRELCYFGQGPLGADFHVAPIHPEFCEKPIPEYNPEKAKALLAEAGYPDGIDIEVKYGATWNDIIPYAEAMKEDAAPAGIRINLNPVPVSVYWDTWIDNDFAIGPWSHRPLGTMVMQLCYTSDSEGKPVPWNETAWVDEEFDQLLREAVGILDVEKRREVFCKLEDIQAQRGGIGISWWSVMWGITKNYVKNMYMHPQQLIDFNEVWKDA